MQPDCRDIKPVYEQITDGIRKMIITHAIPEGEKLPSVRELASKFAINPNAVRKAYQELEEEGYVCDREGERMAASEKQIAELIRKELLQEFDTVVIRLQNMSIVNCNMRSFIYTILAICININCTIICKN